jgi:threonine dehydrogenase-like Zn-dependent dehydrogenase
VDVQSSRLEKAGKLGAARVFNNTDGTAVEEIMRCTGGLGVEVSFEAVGFQATLVQTLQVLKKGGQAVVAGLNAQPEVVIPSNIFVQKEISLSGTQGYCRDFQTALYLLESKHVDLSRFITHTLPFESLQEGFDLLTQPDNDALKVVIVFD